MWSRFDGFYWRRLSGFLSAVFSFMFFSLVLLMPVPRSYAIAPSELIESLQRRLQTISAYASNLEGELQTLKTLSSESEQQAIELVSELDLLRQEVEIWQTASDDLQAQVVRLRELWQASELKLQRVLQSSKNSADSWRAALDASEKRERRLKLTVVLAGIGAALVGAGVGYLIGN